MNDAPVNGVVSATLPDLGTTSPVQWKEYCVQLLAEIERLRSFNDLLQTQRRELLDLLMPDRHRRIEFDEQHALAHIDEKPTLDELLEEFRNQPAGKSNE
jgi:hypothetical protein